MGEAEQRGSRRNSFFRRRQPEINIPFPDCPYPSVATLTAKHIGHCYFNLKKTDYEILARYPTRLTLELVHLGIAHYQRNRAAYEAEIRLELDLNRADSLKDASMTLPPFGPGDLSMVEEMFRAECEEKLGRARAKHRESPARLLAVAPDPGRWAPTRPDPEIVSASDIATWSWCPESWRLRSLGKAPGNRKIRGKGTAFHARTVVIAKASAFALSLGRWLVALAVALAAFALVRG